MREENNRECEEKSKLIIKCRTQKDCRRSRLQVCVWDVQSDTEGLDWVWRVHQIRDVCIKYDTVAYRVQINASLSLMKNWWKQKQRFYKRPRVCVCVTHQQTRLSRIPRHPRFTSLSFLSYEAFISLTHTHTHTHTQIKTSLPVKH